MPEGDTVVGVARRLDDALRGAALTRTDLRVPALATHDLSGRTVLGTATYGKHLLTRLSDGFTLHSHLKMEGRWSMLLPPHRAPPNSSDARRRAADIQAAQRSHHTRALLYTADALAVGSKLGILELLAPGEERSVLGHLGPDLLADDWIDAGHAEAVRRLRSRPTRPLGEALLDQRNLAGLGTFWISEMLFRHHVLPWRTVEEVDDPTLDAVLDDARALMLVSVRTGIQSSTGRVAGETKTVHARSGLPCVRCHDTIRVAMAGPPGQERTLFSCPTCQGGYAPGDDRRPQRPLVERPRRSY